MAGIRLVDESKKGTAPQMFAYTTTDTQATVRASGYFNDVAATIAVGDILFVNGSTGGTMTQSIHTVVSNTVLWLMCQMAQLLVKQILTNGLKVVWGVYVVVIKTPHPTRKKVIWHKVTLM